MDTPTATTLRTWAPPALNWTSYGFPATSEGNTALDVRIGWAIGSLYAITGRKMASITSVEEVAIAQRVIAALVILEALGGGEAALAVMEAPWLKSLAAGSYREERFAPSDFAGKGQPPYPPALWLLMLALMTPEMRDEWLTRLSGQNRPAAAFVEMDWGRQPEYGPLIFGGGTQHWG